MRRCRSSLRRMRRRRICGDATVMQTVRSRAKGGQLGLVFSLLNVDRRVVFVCAEPVLWAIG